MYGFWGGRFEKAFVDVRVFNPSAQSNRHGLLSSVYHKHEQEKRRQYDQRVREVEHATFTPLVLSTTGGMGRAATTFYKRLASMVAEKRDVPYAVTLNWIRCRLSFAPASAKTAAPKRSKNGSLGLKQPGSQKPPRVRVNGARKIWGTLKNTTVKGVSNALTVLGKVPSNALTIKRKYKTVNTDSKRVVRWWFVIRGEEKVLEQLENNWSSVGIQTAWKLEPSPFITVLAPYLGTVRVPCWYRSQCKHSITNPRRACAARVTVFGLSLSVCLSATLFWQYTQVKV